MINKNTSTNPAQSADEPEIVYKDDEKYIDDEDNSNNNSMNVKIITWNLWCIQFVPRTLSNPQRCGKYLLNMAKEQDWSSHDGLILCGLQEIWSWKTGLFPPCLLRLISYFEYIPCFGIVISSIFQLFSVFFGVFLFKCLPIYYNPKKQIISKLSTFLPYSYYDQTIPWQHFSDNGLLFLSNKQPDITGYGGFVNHACNDSLAYKGYIYLYFKQYNILAINTHLQSAGDGSERLEQINEIKEFIERFKKENKIQNELKIIALGDFNVDMTNHHKILNLKKRQENEEHNIEIQNELQQITESKLRRMPRSILLRSLTYQNIPEMLGKNFIKINGTEPTHKDERWGNVDHIFINFKINVETFKEEIRGTESKLSDHLMIVNDIQTI